MQIEMDTVRGNLILSRLHNLEPKTSALDIKGFTTDILLGLWSILCLFRKSLPGIQNEADLTFQKCIHLLHRNQPICGYINRPIPANMQIQILDILSLQLIENLVSISTDGSLLNLFHQNLRNATVLTFSMILSITSKSSFNPLSFS